MRYLITGGAGFIGSHLGDALTAAGHAVLVLDDLSTGRIENIQHLIDARRVRFVEGSTTDRELVDDCLGESDICLHLASTVGVQLAVNSPLETLLDHVRGTDVVMAAAVRRRRRVLFASSSEVYGKRSGPLTEDDDLLIGSPARSRWSYAVAKCFGEATAHAYHAEHGAEVVVARLFNTVGPRQTGRYGMVLPRFVEQALQGRRLSVYGDGTQTRCFTHVSDTVRALMMLCDDDRALGNAYNIGCGSPVTINELARRVIERSGSHSTIETIPYEDAYAPGFEELGRRTPMTTALQSLTGWRAERTIDDAIDDVVEYERKRLGREFVVDAA